jgi:hypothetical protein
MHDVSLLAELDWVRLSACYKHLAPNGTKAEPFRTADGKAAPYILSGTAIPKTANAEVSCRRVILATAINTARLISSSSAIIR